MKTPAIASITALMCISTGVFAQGDAAKGEAAAAACGSCHTADKLTLAGKDAAALTEAMTMIRGGDKAHPPVLNDLTEEDIANLAAYFAAQ